jgi:hypothetical protein
VYCHDLYHRYDQFRDDYGEAFEHAPFMEQTIQFLWDSGKDVSKTDLDNYTHRLTVFREWFDNHVMSLDASSDTVMILPWTAQPPTYRDKTSGLQDTITGITPELLAPVLQMPHLIAPFAQLPFKSVVTARTEYQPVSGSAIGPKGGDLMLIQVVKRAFELAAWRTRVEAGGLAFPIGNNSRNVDDLHVEGARPAMQDAQDLPEMGEL